MIQTEQRFSIRHILVPFISIGIMGYFLYHAFQGDRGFIAYLRLQKKLTTENKECEKLSEQRHILEKRVYLLRPDSLDLDLLEERARSVLNFAEATDIIIHDGSIGSPKREK